MRLNGLSNFGRAAGRLGAGGVADDIEGAVCHLPLLLIANDGELDERLKAARRNNGGLLLGLVRRDYPEKAGRELLVRGGADASEADERL